jgi:hypothetical protein
VLLSTDNFLAQHNFLLFSSLLSSMKGRRRERMRAQFRACSKYTGYGVSTCEKQYNEEDKRS